MTVWNLNRLRYTIRKITGKFDQSQLPDSCNGQPTISNPPGIDDYINDFYLYDFPEHLRLLKLRDFYTFTTIPNCGTYAVPQNVNELEQPIYIDNYQFSFYTNPDQFYQVWPELNFIDRNLFTPNGANSSFTFTLTATPIQQGTVVIGLTPNIDLSVIPTETFTDRDQPIPLDLPILQTFNNPGILVSNQYTGAYPPATPGVTPGTGTIDYLTGACTIVYTTAPQNGATSSCHYHPYVAARPRDIMYFQQQLFIRPIPNDTYSVKLIGYMLPTVAITAATNSAIIPNIAPTTVAGSTTVAGDLQGFTNPSVGSGPTNVPLQNEWFQLMAYGTAIKIFIEDGEHEEANMYKPYFEEAKILAERKTLKQLSTQRIATPYADNNNSGPAYPIYPYY